MGRMQIGPAMIYFFAGFAGAGFGAGFGAGAGAGAGGGGATAGAGAGFGGSGFFSQPIKRNAATISNESMTAKTFFKGGHLLFLQDVFGTIGMKCLLGPCGSLPTAVIT